MVSGQLLSSFRDPSGFVFFRDGAIYRQVNVPYKENYDHLVHSGLLQALVDAELLIPHIEADIGYSISEEAYKIIKPEAIPFISYPYEWSFSQLKAAALTTLAIERKSLEYGMLLKDCSAYNIQFKKGKPILIDTLSFEIYQDGRPWVAYRQFCQHFLAPLALMSYTDVRMNQLYRIYIDGIPLSLARKLLPVRTLFSLSLLSHIHLHSRSQEYFSSKALRKGSYKVSRLSLLGLIDSLESAVKKLKWQSERTEWSNYYEETNYSSESLSHKEELVSDFLEKVNPKIVWDLGANTGVFSRIASEKGIQTISFDIDPACVEESFLRCRRDEVTNIQPLVLDLTNPSPKIGWENEERLSLLERGPADVVLALALIHHLAIGNNLPFNRIASFFSKICKWLIIEFVPKHDSQVQRMLSTREDIFCNYTQEAFEAIFGMYFIIRYSVQIKNSERTLYLMERKSDVKF